MNKSKKLYGILAATMLLAACQTVDRSSVQQSYLLNVPDDAKAVLLFFSGGYGSSARNESGQGSLGLYYDLPPRGIGVAFIHTPSILSVVWMATLPTEIEPEECPASHMGSFSSILK